jgi:hypothetical protein
MSILIVPYEGDNPELTKILEKLSITIPKKECRKGSCPLPKPFRMLTPTEIKSKILKDKDVTVLAMNENDRKILEDLKLGTKIVSGGV